MTSRNRIVALVAIVGAIGACGERSSVYDIGEQDRVPAVSADTDDPVAPGAPLEPVRVTAAGDDSGPSAGFITHSDGGGVSFECDTFSQDCPRGQKCMPWANNGGSAWNATRCVPIVVDPAGEGEPCTVIESGASGLDDCDIGLMCWKVDENGVGYCEDMCTGSPDNPMCDDPNEVCRQSGDGAIALCLDKCDPLLQNCSIPNEVCYPINDDWTCAPDASGRGGAYGDPCEYINACDASLVCVGAAAFSNCVGSLGCCTSVCDVTDPLSDAMCSALDPGQSCEAWYTRGAAPPGYDNVGACLLPL